MQFERTVAPHSSQQSVAASTQHAADAQFVALGTIASRAPHAALLAALSALRPGFEVRLERLGGDGAQGDHYRVQARVDSPSEGAANGTIDLWLRIKSALVAAFPADKPNAVTAWDP